MNAHGTGTAAKTLKVTESIHSLFQKLSSNSNPPQQMFQLLDQAQSLLSCILLATHDYDVANLRIRNSRRYLESNELGAARYEVRLLINGLLSHIAQA